MKIEKKKKTEEAYLPDDTILCPCAVMKIRQCYNRNQMRVLAAIVAKLQPVVRYQFLGLRTEHRAPFPPEKLINGFVVIDLPLSLVDDGRKDYRHVRRALKEMSQMPVTIPFRKDGHEEWQQVGRLLSVLFPERRINPSAYVYIHHTIADSLFSMSGGYFSFSRKTFLACECRSSQLMYLFCERWRDCRLVRMGIGAITQLLQAGLHYRNFYTFRNNKLDAAQRELLKLFKQRKSTCYFTYHPVYEGSNVYGEPAGILFHIHTTDSATSVMEMRQTVCRMLMMHFGFREHQVRRLVARIDEWNYQAVVNKLREMYDRCRQRDGINDVHAYIYAIIRRTIHKFSHEDVKEQELPLAA